MWFLNKIRVGRLLRKCGQEKVPVKLHIGCGSNHKKGKVNQISFAYLANIEKRADSGIVEAVK